VSNAFKILGLLIVLFGFLDMGLLMHRISIHRILDIEVPRFIGPFSYMFEIAYGGLTMFIANYLKTPERKNLSVIDLSDPFIGGETRYAVAETPAPPFKIELRNIAFAYLWGSTVILLYMILSVKLIPAAETLLFSPDSLPPQTRKLLVVGSVLVVLLPLIFAITVLRLREGLTVTAMICGTLISGLLLGAGVMSNAKLGHRLYGDDFMREAYTALGHPNGLPDDWSIEQEIINRLEAAGRVDVPRHRRFN